YTTFQTNNTLNSVTSYMLRVDDNIYSLIDEGVGSTRAINMDPFVGYYQFEEGKNMTMRFHDVGGTFNESHSEDELGAFSYWIIGRRGSIIPLRDHSYLKGPKVQTQFFVNNTDSNTYQGLTNLTMTHPESQMFKIELNYRISLYYWFDQTSNTLSITVNVIFLNIKGQNLLLTQFNVLKLKYNHTSILYENSITNIDSDFYVDGAFSPLFNPYERVLEFTKPGSIVDYNVEIQMIGSYFTLFL
ncbi:MAG: hypothetical protein ACFFDW_15645, partial [Candidatus Thorarchaeota archaeon]